MKSGKNSPFLKNRKTRPDTIGRRRHIMMKPPPPFDSMDAAFAAARKAGKTIRGSVFGVWFRFRVNGTAWPITRKPEPSPAQQILGALDDPAKCDAMMADLRRFFGG
jgi:hypothetical protein